MKKEFFEEIVDAAEWQDREVELRFNRSNIGMV